MPNYQNGKIYKIESLIGNCTYYGSTTKKYLSNRLSGHIYDYKKNKDITSGEVLQYPDAKIYLVESYPCNDKNELTAREGYYIKNNDCVNKRIAGRTDKQYYEDNKEQILKRMEQYRLDNIEKISKYKAQYRLDNIEKLKLKDKQYRLDNIEKISKYNAQYRLDNIEKLKLKYKQYRIDNIEKLKLKDKQYYIKNKEKIKERMMKQCICECGKTYTHINKTKHQRTQHHIKYMSNPFYKLDF